MSANRRLRGQTESSNLGKSAQKSEEEGQVGQGKIKAGGTVPAHRGELSLSAHGLEGEGRHCRQRAMVPLFPETLLNAAFPTAPFRGFRRFASCGGEWEP